LDRDAIAALENATEFIGTAKQKYLIYFYCSSIGVDLIDLYYLKERQLRKGRIVFERTKTNTGTRIDLKLHPKAIGVIDRNKVNGSEWLFRGKIKSSMKCLGVLTSAP
jgi:hypothetical protein